MMSILLIGTQLEIVQFDFVSFIFSLINIAIIVGIVIFLYNLLKNIKKLVKNTDELVKNTEKKSIHNDNNDNDNK